MYTDYSAKYVTCPYEPVCGSKTFVAGLVLRPIFIDRTDLVPGGLCYYEIKLPEGASDRANLVLTISNLDGVRLYAALGESRLTAVAKPNEEEDGFQGRNMLVPYPNNVYLTLQREITD